MTRPCPNGPITCSNSHVSNQFFVKPFSQFIVFSSSFYYALAQVTIRLFSYSANQHLDIGQLDRLGPRIVDHGIPEFLLTYLDNMSSNGKIRLGKGMRSKDCILLNSLHNRIESPLYHES